VAFIEVSGVSKSFPAAAGRRQVLSDVSLSVERGEFVAIVGAMGTGKTTLLHLLGGLLMPDAGSIVVDGTRVSGVRRDAALVFQNYSLLPWFSALENVRLAIEAAAPERPTSVQREQAARALELVGLGNALHRRPGQLSGGMRQRVAIARAFAIEPEILFLDEPFGALDALTRETLQQELVRLCGAVAKPVTVVMITNNVEEAILLSDRIVPLSRGPAATLGVPIPVTLSRPRTAAALLHDDKALRVRSHIIEVLTENSHRRTNRPVRPLDADRPALEALRVATSEVDGR